MVRFRGKDEPYPAAEPNGLRLHIFKCCLQKQHIVHETLGIGTKPQTKRRRHCNLQVCIPRHQNVFILFALTDQDMKKLFYRFGNLFYLRTGKKFQVQQNLIISGTATMYFSFRYHPNDGSTSILPANVHLPPRLLSQITFFARGINTLQFHQQLVQFFFCQQPNAFQAS